MTTKPKKKTNIQSKKLTVNEFKVWLDGLCAFNEENWAPSLQQWLAIKDKIMNLQEEPQVRNNQTPVAPSQRESFGMRDMNSTAAALSNETLFPTLTPEEIDEKLRNIKNGGPKIITGNIDSSNGYRPQFD